MNTTVADLRLIDFNLNKSQDGSLVAVESMRDIPIEIRRIFYVYDSDGKNRGNHAHKETRQVLICVSGKVVVTCSDGDLSKSFTLDTPSKGLFIPEMIWDSVDYCEENTVLLVMSDTKYNREDYIENFENFKDIKYSLL